MTGRRFFWSTVIDSGGFGPILYTPPLDVYSGAKMAYGLRLLRTAYTGPLFELRRTSDNVLLDIYAESNGLFDESIVLSFVSNGTFTCVISKLYDQSGNGFHINSVNIAGSFPFIIPALSTTFEKISSKNCLKTVGGFFSNNTAWMYAASANSFIAVVEGPNTNPSSATLVGEGRSSSANPVYSPAFKYNSTNSPRLAQFIRNDANTIVVTSNLNNMGDLFDNSPHIVYNRDSSSNFRTIIDDISDINVNYTRSGTLTLDRFSFLALRRNTDSNGFNNLKMAEIIFFDSNQDSNASGLMTNLNNYYGTY